MSECVQKVLRGLNFVGFLFCFLIVFLLHTVEFHIAKTLKTKICSPCKSTYPQCPRRYPSTPMGDGFTAHLLTPNRSTRLPTAMSTFKFLYGGKGLQKNQFTNRATSSVWPFISDTPPLSPVLTVHDIPLICLMKI